MSGLTSPRRHRLSAVGFDSTTSSNVRWKIFFLLMLVVAVNYIDRASLSIALPLIKDEFHISPEVTGIILSTFFWTYFLMQVPAGILADKFGVRRVIAGSAAAWGAAQAANALAFGPWSLGILRGLLGFTEAPLFPAGAKVNGVWMPRNERGRGAVLLDGGVPLGSALGGATMAALIAWTGSWRISFLILGVLTVALAGLVWWYLRDTPADHPNINEDEVEYIRKAHAEEDAIAAAELEAEAAAGATPAPRFAFAKYPAFWFMNLGYFGKNIIFYGILTWGALFLSEAHGFDIAEIGWSTFVIFSCGLVGEFFSGIYADRLTGRGHSINRVYRTMMGIAGVLVTVALLSLAVPTTPTVAVVTLCVAVFFLRWFGLYWAVPSLLGGRSNAGVLGGVMNFAGNISGVITPIIVGITVGASGGFAWAMLYFAGAGVIMTISSIFLDYSRRLPVSTS